MLKMRLITVTVLLLTAIICNGQDVSNESNSSNPDVIESIDSDGEPIYIIESRVNIAHVINSASNSVNLVFDGMKFTLNNLSTGLTTSFANLSSTARSFVRRIVASITNRGVQVEEEIEQLQQQFDDPKYSKCFNLQGAVSGVANTTVNAATKCVENIINNAQSTFNSISSNVMVLINAVDAYNNADKECATSYSPWACKISATSMSAMSMATATTNITVTATQASLYFSNLVPQVIKCGAIEANFMDYAFNAVRKVTSCINGVMNPKETAP